MKKLRIGTVFSGIGAMEHGLERLSVPHTIVFAADNGNRNIFEVKIRKSVFAISKKLQHYERMNDAPERFTEARALISELEEGLLAFKKMLREKYGRVLRVVHEVMNIEEEQLPKRLKQYTYDSLQTSLYDYEMVRDSVNYVLKQGKVHEKTKKALKREWEAARKTNEARTVNVLYSRLQQMINQFNQELESEKIHKAMQGMTYQEKKEYVDRLYAQTNRKNYVEKTYRANYEVDDDHFYQDVTFMDGSRYQDVDLFVGGSPCQSFSVAGYRQGLEDTRGTLFFDYARLIQEIQPKTFIYENVRGLLQHDKGKTWEIIKKTFESLNYDIHFQVLDAKDYGIPQTRRRVFVVGFRKDLPLQAPFRFPEPVELTTVVADYLEDRIAGRYFISEKGVRHVTNEERLKKRYTQIDGDISLCQMKNQQINLIGDFVFVEEQQKPNVSSELERYFLSAKVEKYVMSDGTHRYHAKPTIDTDIAKPILATCHKMHRASQDNYVTTDGRLRRLTPKECLRLMGFCSSFKIPVSDTQAYSQAGNSIVVDVLMAIYCEIEKTGVYEV